MENEHDQLQQPDQEPYVPRPRWQVWGARIGVVLMIIFVLLFYYNVSRGGL